MKEFWDRFKKSPISTIAGIVVGAIQVYVGIKTGNYSMVITGAGTALLGSVSKDK